MSNREEIIARAFFVADNGKGEVYHMELQLVPHGGFDYGNRHSVVLKRGDGSWDECFDARYDRRFDSAESFDKYAYEFVRDQVSNAFAVTREEKGE